MESQHTVKIVGRGAYGVVYLCLDKDGRNYITKHIPVSDMSPTERQSAMNEVNTSSTETETTPNRKRSIF